MLLGLGFLRGPALALRIGDTLAGLGAEDTAFLRLFGGRLAGFGLSYFDSDIADAGQQGANLGEPGNFGVDEGKN